MFCSQPAFAASYKDDIGHTALIDELGAGAPDGYGVHVTHVEALSDNKWMPDTASAAFSGKTIVDQSTEHPGGYSGHANGVGGLFYGNSSMAPGIVEIDAYVAALPQGYPDPWPPYPPPWQWLLEAFLAPKGTTQYQPLYNMPVTVKCNSPNLSSPSRIANHSWVGTTGSAELLRRLDWVVDTDEFIQVVASHTTSALLSSAFNVIAVGRTSGEPVAGTPFVDNDYSSGRTVPHVAAPQSNLSRATPTVAAVAALLVETGRNQALSTDPLVQWTVNRDGDAIWNAERSEVLKAVIMAGADRFTRNTSTSADIVDYRSPTLSPSVQSANGLDRRYGAGQVNIYNSYKILAAGEQNSSRTGAGDVGWRGFDYEPSIGITRWPGR